MMRNGFLTGVSLSVTSATKIPRIQLLRKKTAEEDLPAVIVHAEWKNLIVSVLAGSFKSHRASRKICTFLREPDTIAGDMVRCRHKSKHATSLRLATTKQAAQVAKPWYFNACDDHAPFLFLAMRVLRLGLPASADMMGFMRVGKQYVPCEVVGDASGRVVEYEGATDGWVGHDWAEHFGRSRKHL